MGRGDGAPTQRERESARERCTLRRGCICTCICMYIGSLAILYLSCLRPRVVVVAAATAVVVAF